MSMMNCYCVDEITIIKHMGNDSWGEPESGEMVTVKGYVEWKTRLIRNSRGEECVSSCMIYLPRRRTVNALGRGLLMEDRIILDQGGAVEHYSGMPDEALSRAIVEIRQPKDFSSPHYEVSLA
jgi:hypothetical protein